MIVHTKGTAVVTGASSGIGRGYAWRLARRGYDLILVARGASNLTSLAEDIADATGRKTTVIVADLASKSDLTMLETLLRTDPTITMLVNNAGVGAVDTLLESNVEAMETMIALNVTVLTRLAYAVVPGLAARGSGSIINVGSALAIAPELFNGVYGATKAFVLAFSLSLHKELEKKNIRIQVVLPGAVATDFWKAAGGSLDSIPADRVMHVDDLVDAALAGYDQGELVTIPSLPDRADWLSYEAARQKLIPNLSLNLPAPRYRILATA